MDAGERVAVRLRYYGRGKGSGVEIETEMYRQVATFRDGTIVRMEYFTDWPQALDAAGAPPPPGLSYPSLKPVDLVRIRGETKSKTRPPRAPADHERR